MKYTLLDLTQTVLSSMDSDEVTSILDTIESTQVVKILKTTYFELLSSADLSEHKGLFTLTATSSSTPTAMTKPTDIENLDWFKYNKRITTDTTDVWGYVSYIEPSSFLDLSHSLDQSDTTNVASFTLTADSYSTTVYVNKTSPPEHWTSFDDLTIVCDAYDSVVDSTGLTSVKTSCFGRRLPSWTESDSFTPDLDDQQFGLLLNEAKALAWAEMKQTMHAKAEKKVREGRIRLERSKQDLPAGDRTWTRSLPNYGRK